MGPRLELSPDTARIEALVVGNHAEAGNNGLVYLSGAGWGAMNRGVMPDGQTMPANVGIAVFLYVPWNETNRPMTLSVGIESEDGAVIAQSPDLSISVGRPPDLPQGSPQYPNLAANLLVGFPHAGGYRVIARLDGGKDVRMWQFHVRDIPQQQQGVA